MRLAADAVTRAGDRSVYRAFVRATELIHLGFVLPIRRGTYRPLGSRRRPPGWLHLPAEHFGAEIQRAGSGDRVEIVQPGGYRVVPTGSSASS